MYDLILSLALGVLTALAAGAVSGLTIGAKVIGAELAGSMGGLYGLLSGFFAIIIGSIVLTLFS